MNETMKKLSSILFLFLAVGLMAQVPKPAAPQTEPIALVGGTIHLGTGEVIEGGIITFSEGKITSVGTSVDLAGYRQIDVSDQHVYPGLILPNSSLGLTEVNAVRATRDFAEVGDVIPHVRSLIAYNTDSELIPTLRRNGIQLAQISPKGGRVKGTSSVVKLDGWNWEDAAYAIDDGVHMEWPRQMLPPRWWMNETKERENEKYDEQVKSIMKLISDAKSYTSIDQADKNLKLEAMRGVLDGSQRLYVAANDAREIIQAITSLKKAGIPNVVLVGGADSWRVTDLLKKNEIPVIVEETHSLPARDDEHIDLKYRLPALLQDAGIMVAVQYEDVMSSRNLAFQVGSVAAYGTSKEMALQMITLNAAKILGIAQRTGSLESGKDANIIVSKGDLLDMRSNEVTHSFIVGREVVLDGKQELLYERFKAKYSE